MDYTAVVTYRGDITKKLKECGTSCPFRLNGLGNTVQEVHTFLRSDLATTRRIMEAIMLESCRKNGEVITVEWQ